MTKTSRSKGPFRAPSRRASAGFTLVEMMIALAIFAIISAAAFSLMAQNQPLFNQQQNLAEVNIALRNSVAQMQLDIANAGANYYPTVDIPNYPVGVVIKNHVVASGGDCRTGTPKVYSTNCFDQMSIITADKLTPPMNPSINPVTPGGDASCTATANGATAAANSTSTRSSTTTYLIPPAGSTTAQINTLAGNFLNGDQILFISNDGARYTTAALTAAGASYPNTTSPTYIKLTHGATSSDTPSPALPSPAPATFYGYNASGSSNDPYGMTSDPNTMLTEGFCATDWVLRLTPVTYKVDTSTDPNNPTLLRQVAGLSQTTAQQNLANQIIGFKVGAVLFDNTTTDTPSYCFDSTMYDPTCPNNTTSNPAYANNYTVVRSVMVSLIGRTNPKPGPAYVFQNSFDGGPYEIQGVSVIINPRNMSF